MGGQSRGLGRGLDALLGGAAQGEEYNASEVRQLRISSIVPNKFQPRAEFSPEALEDLAASIKAQGVLQPILVRPLTGGSFELVAGERRLRASKIAGLTEIPGLIREMDDEQSLAIALIENLQREDLNAIEEAKGYRQLMDQFGLSQEALAAQVGKSRSAVSNALRLLKLPASVQMAISSGRVTAGHGRAVMAVDDEAAIQELYTRIDTKGLSVRQAEAEAGYYKEHGSFPETTETVVRTLGSGPVRKSGAVDEQLVSLKNGIEDSLGLRVSVSGSSSKGKVTIQFTNSDDFAALVDHFGAGN
ncbi:MAG: ParB/RepB/Spo0J family partition protein [Proteobacteria bacterium]|nr:ParB/RepB/Spo0J family partition protein [Pseudomonadota bacterium]